MASLDKLEGDGLEALGVTLVLVVIGIIVVAYLGAKSISLPVSLYPDQLWNHMASFIDGIFYSGPQVVKPISDPIQHRVDNYLASGYEWINSNLPRSTNSAGWNDYASQFNGPDASYSGGTDTGLQFDPNTEG